MTQLIPIMDAKKRDAHVAAEWPRREKPPRMVAKATKSQVRLERLVRATDATSYDGLRRRLGDDAAIAKALVAGDPEIDLALVGRKLGDVARVFLRKDGTILVMARVLQVVRAPDGTEKSRADLVDVEATVKEDGTPLPWTGRLFALDETVRKFAFTRKLQLKHVSGLTFEFLYEMAKTLQTAGKLLYVGSGQKGQGPLIFATNGAPYRGFLEGRVDETGYKLVLHLSNLELKALAAGEG